MRFLSTEASVLILQALLDNTMHITSFDDPKFKTTRVSDHISALRDMGLIIRSDIVKFKGKKRCMQYSLIPTDENLKRAVELFRQLTVAG